MDDAESLIEAILEHADALRGNTEVLGEIKEILAAQSDMIQDMMPERGEDIPVQVTKSPELSVLPGIDLPDDSA